VLSQSFSLSVANITDKLSLKQNMSARALVYRTAGCDGRLCIYASEYAGYTCPYIAQPILHANGIEYVPIGTFIIISR